MNDFLTKPFSPTMLEACVLNVLQQGNRKSRHVVASGAPKNDAVEINLQHLLDLGNGDPFFVRDMTEIYLAETPVAIAELHQALTHREPEQVYRIVHQLKPNFGLLGMKTQEEIALAVEKAIKSGNPDWNHITQLVHRLDAGVQHSCGVLRERMTGA